MPINSTHPDYDEKKPTLTQDAFEGEVKQTKYVPKLSKQSTTKYNQYVDRGSYYNVILRTTSAIIGTILRKLPSFDDSFKQVQELTQREFIVDLLKGLLLQGRSGILTDFNEELQEAEMIPVQGQNIINWRDDKSLIVLKESVYKEDPSDRYKLIPSTNYREMFLDDDGIYNVRLWEQSSNKTWKVVDEFIPNFRGQTLDYIPFEFVNPFDTTPEVHNPVLYNLAQLNVSHFRTSVDLEHVAHYSALPTPWIAGEFASGGEEVETQEVLIGSETVWQLTPESKVGFLEFAGISIDSLADIMHHKEEQMLNIGIRLLSDKKGVESADSLKIRSNSENATLLGMVFALESAIKDSLTTINFWSNIKTEPLFEMSKDFNAATLSDADIKIQLELLNENRISIESFLENLVDGEIITDVDQEIKRINSNIINKDTNNNITTE